VGFGGVCTLALGAAAHACFGACHPSGANRLPLLQHTDAAIACSPLLATLFPKAQDFMPTLPCFSTQLGRLEEAARRGGCKGGSNGGGKRAGRP